MSLIMCMKNCPNCKEEVPSQYDICWNCNYNFISKNIHNFESTADRYIVEPKKLKCLRCQNAMSYVKSIGIAEMPTWSLFGEDGHSFNKNNSFDIYMCLNCYKVEWFAPMVVKHPDYN